MIRLLELTVGGVATPWTTFGLIDSSPQPHIAGVRISFNPNATGLVSWAVSGIHSHTTSIEGSLQSSIDGIPTSVDAPPIGAVGLSEPSAFGGSHAIAIDHVVVNTDNLERTSAAFTQALGTDLRRVRDAGRGVTQGFHVLDNTVIEIVSGPHITQLGASLWGFVVVVDDIHAVVATLGDMATPVKPAVQPGRFISSVRTDAGLGVPVALMSPRV